MYVMKLLHKTHYETRVNTRLKYYTHARTHTRNVNNYNYYTNICSVAVITSYQYICVNSMLCIYSQYRGLRVLEFVHADVKSTEELLKSDIKHQTLSSAVIFYVYISLCAGSKLRPTLVTIQVKMCPLAVPVCLDWNSQATLDPETLTQRTLLHLYQHAARMSTVTTCPRRRNTTRTSRTNSLLQ